MPVLVASKFEEDLIDNEHHFFHHSRARNSKMIDQNWPLFELVRDFMPVLVACKFNGDRIQSN